MRAGICFHGLGSRSDDIRVLRTTELRYVGQGHQVAVLVPDGILSEASGQVIQRTFEDQYRLLYQRTAPGNPIETVNCRVVVTGPTPTIPSIALEGDHVKPGDGAIKGYRDVYDPESGAFSSTPVYDRYRLRPGDSIDGPAIVEERESTFVLGANATAKVDEFRNLVIDMTER